MSMLGSNKKLIKEYAKKCFLMVVSIFFLACQSDDDHPIIEQTMNGFWLLEDKGYIIEITDDKKVLYNVNAVGCVVQEPDFDTEDFVGLELNQTGPNELIGSSDLLITDFKLTRLLSQNEFCLPDQIADTEDPKVNFDHFWNVFNDYYAFFEIRNVDWAQYESLRDQVTSENFYETLGQLVLLLEDGHVGVFNESEGIGIDAGLPSLLARLNSNLSGDLVIDSGDVYDRLYNQRLEVIALKYLGGDFEIDESENMAWGLINNDIGYINILGMGGYGSDESNELETLNNVLDKMMEDLKNSGASKLIIDTRFNGGGLDKVSVEIASRFVSQERLAFSKKARLGNGFTESVPISVGPKGDFQFMDTIVLLTSPITASAAEIFALCLKDLSYVTIVGENTNGVFSDILAHNLPNGTVVTLSNEVYSDAQGIVYEAVGIGPTQENNVVPLFSDDDFIDEKDSGIDRAVELLNTTD